MEFLLLIIIFGIVVGAIADSKGRNAVLWGIYGAALFLVAIIHVLLIKPTEKAKIENGAKNARAVPRL